LNWLGFFAGLKACSTKVRRECLVTFEAFDGLTSILRMQRSIALALILLIAAVAPGCVAGWNGADAAGCGKDQRAVLHKKGTKERCARTNCGPQVKPQHDRCGFRSFVQLQFARSRPATSDPPKLLMQGKVPIQPAVTLALSSIGSPHSDRGPPSLHES
jgi:hypothetical protein